MAHGDCCSRRSFYCHNRDANMMERLILDMTIDIQQVDLVKDDKKMIVLQHGVVLVAWSSYTVLLN